MFLRNITDEKYRSHAGDLLLSLTGETDQIPQHYWISALVDRLVAVMEDDILDDMHLPRNITVNALTGLPEPTSQHQIVRFQQDQPRHQQQTLHDDTLSVPPTEMHGSHVQGFVIRLWADRDSDRGPS